MQPSLTPRNTFLAQALTYGGTLPFIAATLCHYINWPEIDILFFLRCYSGIIIAFLCGIHWAIFLFFSGRCHRNLLITSNFIALMAWASVVLPLVKHGLVLQSLCFLYMLVLDFRMKEAGIIATWFYNLRHNATAIVVFCLCMLAFK